MIVRSVVEGYDGLYGDVLKLREDFVHIAVDLGIRAAHVYRYVEYTYNSREEYAWLKREGERVKELLDHFDRVLAEHSANSRKKGHTACA